MLVYANDNNEPKRSEKKQHTTTNAPQRSMKFKTRFYFSRVKTQFFCLAQSFSAHHNRMQWAGKSTVKKFQQSEIIKCIHTDACINFNLTKPQGQQARVDKKQRTRRECVNKTERT